MWAARHEAAGGAYTKLSLFSRADIAIHTGDVPTARAYLTRISDGIASGHLPVSDTTPLHQLGQGQLARLEGRMEDASAYFREVLASNLAAKESWLTQWCLVGLAVMNHSAGMDASARDLLARALSLDPDGNQLHSPLPALVAAVAELVVESDAERGSVIWSMAACLGHRARYMPMYPQDVARITAILDQAREAHGIPFPDVPADLTAADAIAQCLEALASMDATLEVIT